VRGEIWETQKSWRWHFNQIANGEDTGVLTAQTLVAFSSTTVMRAGRTHCVLLVLWQSAEAEMDFETNRFQSNSIGDYDMDDNYESGHNPGYMDEGAPWNNTSFGEDESQERLAEAEASQEPVDEPVSELWNAQAHRASIAHREHSKNSTPKNRLSVMGGNFELLFADVKAVRTESKSDAGTEVGSEPKIEELDDKEAEIAAPAPEGDDIDGPAVEQQAADEATTQSNCVLQGRLTPADSRNLQAARASLSNFLENKIYPVAIERCERKEAARLLLQRSVYPAATKKAKWRIERRAVTLRYTETGAVTCRSTSDLQMQ